MKRLDFRTVCVVLLAAAGCKGDPTADLRTGLNSLEMNPDLMFIDQGTSKGFEVVARDQQLNPVAASVTVTSVDPNVVTVEPDTSVPSADNAHFDYIVSAVGAGQTQLVASSGGVSDTAIVTVLPTSFNGVLTPAAPRAGDTVRIAATALLKFDTASVAVEGPAGSIVTILAKTPDELTVLAPAGSGVWTIDGVDVTYVPGLTVALETAPVTTTGSLWAASSSWQTAPNISNLIPAPGGAPRRMTVAPVSPNNSAVCPEVALGFGSAGPCMMFRFDLAAAANVSFATDWDGTTATDVDVYVCADTTVAGFGANCFEDGGAGATGAKPQTTGPANAFTAGSHWFVIELYAGTTTNTYVTIRRLP